MINKKSTLIIFFSLLVITSIALAVTTSSATAQSTFNNRSAAAVPLFADTPAVGATPASAQITLQVANNAALGSFVADDKGRTLYVFMMDTGNTSSCTDACATMWPPATGSATPGDGIDPTLMGSITRADGSTQLTYNNHPLYYFSQDSNPGDTEGQGFKNNWYVISPGGDVLKSIEATASPNMSGTPEAPSQETPDSPMDTPSGGGS